jgi:hypothetical protein
VEEREENTLVMGPVSATIQYVHLCCIYGYNEYMNKGSGLRHTSGQSVFFQFF